MPGHQHLLMGIGIFVVGGIITAGSLAISNGSFGVIAWGAMLVGALQAAWGLCVLAFEFLRGDKGREKHRAKQMLRYLVRSVVAVASADGKLHQSEISMLSVILGSVLGQNVPEATIKGMYNSMKSQKTGFEELEDMPHWFQPNDAKLVMKCMMMVAHADGDLDPAEDKLLSLAAIKLGLWDAGYAVLMEEARKAARVIRQVSERAQTAQQ